MFGRLVLPFLVATAGAHLHHGHNTSGGDTFNDAYWITTSTGIGSDDITLYK
ncbi:MAG: hypothetical protein M9925_02540 [Chloroflexi bacterium]|jgi:hypothetical protein|nr:hypothetical protein [Chloroflexota bacterium]